MDKTIYQIIKENIDTDNADNIRKLDEQGWTEYIFSKDYLEHAARIGAAKVTEVMANKRYPRITPEAKIDAMFVAAQAHQVETVKVLANSGVSLTYALGAINDTKADKDFVEALLHPVTGLKYEPNSADTNFFSLAGKTVVLDALNERDKKAQDIYKEAFNAYIQNQTDDTERTMLSAAATGTAAHIDYHVYNGEPVNNKGLLQNLDAALWHGNSNTAQALIKHGAKIEPQHADIARRYCNQETLEAIKAAQLEQIQPQAPTTNQKAHRPARKVNKTKGMSL